MPHCCTLPHLSRVGHTKVLNKMKVIRTSTYNPTCYEKQKEEEIPKERKNYRKNV